MEKFLLNWFIINVQKKKSFDWLFQDKNVYTRTFDDISHLAKSSHPPSDNQKTPAQRPGSKLMKTMPQHQPGLDRIYRGCKPTRPMHLSKYGLERDPISRHGMQLIESHKTEMRGNIMTLIKCASATDYPFSSMQVDGMMSQWWELKSVDDVLIYAILSIV